MTQHVRAARAERFPQADFAGPLRDGHQHDVHDHNAADHQRHDDDPRNDGDEDAADPGPEALHAFGRIQHEVVVLLGPQMAPAAHDALGLRNRLPHLQVRACLHEKGVENPGWIHQVLRRRQRGDDDKAVERESEDAALVLHHADHAIRHAADAHTLPERVAIGEQALGDGLAEHRYGRAGAVLFARKRAPDGDAQVLDVEVPLARGGELDVPRFLVAVGDGDLIARLPGGDHRNGQPGADRFGVAETNARAAAPCAPHGVRHIGVEHGLPAELKRVHAVQRLRELLRHVAVHAVGDGPGGNE